MRRTTRGGLAAMAALCAVAALPGTAGADPGDLPPYRTADGAEARKGAASSADGPRLAKDGIYTDKLAPGDKKYYSVALDARSNAWFSAVALPKAGSKVAFNDGLTITLEDTDGTECSSDDVTFGGDGAAQPVAASTGRIVQPDGECEQAGVYNVSVERSSESTSDPSVWPIELRFMQEPPIKGGTATTPPESGDLPTTPPDPPTSEAKPLKGGTGFNDAVGMGPGVWKDRIKPGETRFYRVPVDWGQQLSLSAEFGTAKASDKSAYVADGVRVKIYNPTRGGVNSDSAMYQPDEPAAVPVLAPPVDYVNRFSYDSSISPSAFAGWYYVAVHANPAVGDFVKGSVPVTLRTTVTGKAKKGPAYDGDAAKAGFGVSDDDKDQAADGKTAAQADDGDSDKKLLAYGGIGAGTVLILILAGWTLTARRRATVADAVPYGAHNGAGYGPPQQYQPPPQYDRHRTPEGW